jgi:hypothetical protein
VLGLVWADVSEVGEARAAADAMARDGGWEVVSIEEVSGAMVEEFDGEGREHFHRAEAQGMHMVLIIYPDETPPNRDKAERSAPPDRGGMR